MNCYMIIVILHITMNMKYGDWWRWIDVSQRTRVWGTMEWIL
mgnify:CR=1 FL=1